MTNIQGTSALKIGNHKLKRFNGSLVKFGVQTSFQDSQGTFDPRHMTLNIGGEQLRHVGSYMAKHGLSAHKLESLDVAKKFALIDRIKEHIKMLEDGVELLRQNASIGGKLSSIDLQKSEYIFGIIRSDKLDIDMIRRYPDVLSTLIEQQSANVEKIKENEGETFRHQLESEKLSSMQGTLEKRTRMIEMRKTPASKLLSDYYSTEGLYI